MVLPDEVMLKQAKTLPTRYAGTSVANAKLRVKSYFTPVPVARRDLRPFASSPAKGEGRAFLFKMQWIYHWSVPLPRNPQCVYSSFPNPLTINTQWKKRFPLQHYVVAYLVVGVAR